MRKLGKSFLMIVMLLCMFSYMGVVKADTAKLSSVEKNSISAVSNLLTGKQLSTADKEKIDALSSKYNLYYQYQIIDSDVYSKYKSGDDAAGVTIANLITDPDSEDDMKNAENGWSQVVDGKVTYSDLEYDAQNPKGYVVALMSVLKSDANKIYTYKSVYQATSATTLATYESVSKAEDIQDQEVTKEQTVEEPEESDDSDSVDETDSEEVEKSEENPETGISDYAIYMVPLSLVLGTTLYLKRRNA